MSRDELAIALEELADAIRELGDAIDGRSRSDDGDPRPNLLSPPSVRDVLRTADERAIPALITLLEAQIRTLRYLQRGSRFARRGKAVDDRLRGAEPRAPDRSADPDAVLDQLGSTLERIGRRLEGSADEETRDLLDRTRSLYEEIDTRLADYERQLDDDRRETSGGRDGYRIDISEPGSDETDATTSQPGAGADRDDDSTPKERRSTVDVDAELDTLRERYGPDEEPSETDGDESASAEQDDADPDLADRADAEPKSGDARGPENAEDAADGTEERDDSRNTHPGSSGDSETTDESEPPAEDDDSPEDR